MVEERARIETHPLVVHEPVRQDQRGAAWNWKRESAER